MSSLQKLRLVRLHKIARLQKKLLCIVVLGMTLGAHCTAVAKVHRASKRDARREIEDLEEQWRLSQINGDLTAMDHLLSDDFVGISMTGQANTKEQQLDRYRKRRLVINKMELSDSKVKLVGSVAIVTSRAEVEGMNEGTPIKGTFRYTRIYQRLPSGVWTTTNFEATRVPADQKAPPPETH